MKLKELLSCGLTESEQRHQLTVALIELDDTLVESELLLEFSLQGLKNKLIVALGGTPPEKKEDDVKDTPKEKSITQKATKLAKAITTAKLSDSEIKELMKKAKKGNISVKEIEDLADAGAISKSVSGAAKHKAGKRERAISGKKEIDDKRAKAAREQQELEDGHKHFYPKVPNIVKKEIVSLLKDDNYSILDEVADDLDLVDVGIENVGSVKYIHGRDLSGKLTRMNAVRHETDIDGSFSVRVKFSGFNNDEDFVVVSKVIHGDVYQLEIEHMTIDGLIIYDKNEFY
jgi:hypothetical protein